MMHPTRLKYTAKIMITTAIRAALVFLVAVSMSCRDPFGNNSSEQKAEAECGIRTEDKDRYFERFGSEGWQELIKNEDGSCRVGISILIADIITSGNSIKLSDLMRGFDDELKNMSEFLGVADQIVVQNNKLEQLLECRKKIISFQNEDERVVFNPLIIKSEIDQLREAIKNYFGKPYRNGYAYAYSDLYKNSLHLAVVNDACEKQIKTLSENDQASNELELLKVCLREDNYASLEIVGKAHPEFWEETQKFWKEARDLINQCDLSK